MVRFLEPGTRLVVRLRFSSRFHGYGAFWCSYTLAEDHIPVATATSALMRHPKNPDHPLVRLRAALKPTREQLAKRTGIPVPSLKDIGRGVYALSSRLAAQISLTTPVNPKSLLLGEDPLLDWNGQPPNPDSPLLPQLESGPSSETTEAIRKSLSGAAEQERKAMLLDWLYYSAWEAAYRDNDFAANPYECGQ